MGLPNLPALKPQSQAVTAPAVKTTAVTASAVKTEKTPLYDLVIDGDLNRLNPEQRIQYLTKLCEGMGLNPMTRPFGLIKLDGKVTLYALKEASTQLAKRDTVTVKLGDFVFVKERNMLMVSVTASTPDGRVTDDVAAVAIGDNVKGEAAANSYMKLATKAKRRAILTHCGLGIIDESELDTVRNSEVIRNEPARIEAQKSTPVAVQEAEEIASVVSDSEGDDDGAVPSSVSDSQAFNYNDTNDRQWLIDSVKQFFPNIKRGDALAICATFAKVTSKQIVVDTLTEKAKG